MCQAQALPFQCDMITKASCSTLLLRCVPFCWHRWKPQTMPFMRLQYVCNMKCSSFCQIVTFLRFFCYNLWLCVIIKGFFTSCVAVAYALQAKVVFENSLISSYCSCWRVCVTLAKPFQDLRTHVTRCRFRVAMNSPSSPLPIRSVFFSSAANLAITFGLFHRLIFIQQIKRHLKFNAATDKLCEITFGIAI